METKIKKIIGYVLLSPAIFSVFLFITSYLNKQSSIGNEVNSMDVITIEKNNWTELEYNIRSKNFNYSIWTGLPTYNREGGVGGFTSALPFYFGLMAIAGAYLIKDNK